MKKDYVQGPMTVVLKLLVCIQITQETPLRPKNSIVTSSR